MTMFDALIRSGTVHDGHGGEPRVMDIGVLGGKVTAMGDLRAATARRDIDAAGLAVTPGFIDLHTHSDFTLLVDGRAQSQVHQGVTTEVIGQCGISCAPLREHGSRNDLSGGFSADAARGKEWRGFGEYLDVLEQGSLGVNVAAFVGHGTVHRAVLGDALHAGEVEDIARMKRLVEQALDDGAAGLSSGLEYWPGILSAPEHLVPLCEAAAARGKLYATHVRNRDRYYDLGFGEAIAAARQSGARLQISHIQTKYGAPAFAGEHTMELVEAARRHGVDVAFDVIPHDWNNTGVIGILPKWAREGGTRATLVRLEDPIVRRKVKDNPSPMLLIVQARQWHQIVLLNARVNQNLVGMDFGEIGRMRGVDPYDAVMDMLIEEGDDAPLMMWATRSFTESEIEMFMQDNACAVISDTAALAPDGALKDQLFSLSGYGWAARFLQHYVRDRQVLSLPEAIRRITALPASRLGLRDRGTLQVGHWADITVFDPVHVESRFSVREPRAYAGGIAHVMVNGVLAMHDGLRTALNSGRVLREFHRQ
jgi:N-acyl-D-aspartate/D-glutamate deacylase